MSLDQVKLARMRFQNSEPCVRKQSVKPKIAYLIDESHGWDEGPHWGFYPEEMVPRYKIEHAPKETYKRIVYFEIDD